MGAGDWAPDDRRETRIAGGVFALLLAVAVIAYAALGYCSVWRHARPGRVRVLPVVAAEV
jgi:hypothetical protein